MKKNKLMDIKGELCGESKEIYYDKKIKELNLMLGINNCEAPVIIFQDWTGKGKDLFVLHIKEAMELKGIIDRLVLDWNEYQADEIKAELDIKEK